MVALQPRFLVLLGLCVAASSSALSVPPADAPAAPATVHESVHVPRSTPDVALPAKVPHVARNTPDLPKVIPSKMIKRAGPPKLPTPAMPKLPVPNHLRSVPELPAKLPVSKKDLRSVPAPALPKLPSDKPSAPNPPKVPAKLPQSLKRDEPPAVPKLPLPVPLPVPAPNSAAMIPPPKRSHDAPNANLPQPHLLVDRPRVSRDMSTGSIDTVLAALTDDEEDGHQKVGSNDEVLMSPVDNSKIAQTHSDTHKDGFKSDDFTVPAVEHSYAEERPNHSGKQDTELLDGMVHEHQESRGMSI